MIKGIIHTILAAVFVFSAASVMAVGLDSVDYPADKDVVISWAALNSVNNSVSVQNTNKTGKTSFVECQMIPAGTNIMTIWLQSSYNNTNFANAHTTGMAINNNDADSFIFRGNIKGGSYWRLHTEDTDVDVTNTVTGTCVFGR